MYFSMESWDMAEEETEDRDWPELLSDVSVVGGAGHGAGLPRLKRGQGSRHLGVDMTFNPDEEEGTEQRNKYFTSSGKQSKKAVKHRHKHIQFMNEDMHLFDYAVSHYMYKILCLLRFTLKSSFILHTDEDLIKHILTDGQNFFPQADESEMADL